MLSAEGQWTSSAHLKVCVVGLVLGLVRPVAAYSILPLHRTSLLAPDNHNEIFFNFGHPLHGVSPIEPSVSSNDKDDDLPDARRAARFALQLQQLETVNKDGHDEFIAAGYKEGAGGAPKATHSPQHHGLTPSLSASLPASHHHQLLSTGVGDSFASVHHELDAEFDLHDGSDFFDSNPWH
ncbi:hypothetical protein FHG87_014058 [Trinorchestia longiramus]|nr:hypothetical protein FHG87_014058 [Trinorchestia longiramus]